MKYTFRDLFFNLNERLEGTQLLSRIESAHLLMIA